MVAVIQPEEDALATPQFTAEGSTSSSPDVDPSSSHAPPMDELAAGPGTTSGRAVTESEGREREVGSEQDRERARTPAEVRRNLRQLEESLKTGDGVAETADFKGGAVRGNDGKWTAPTPQGTLLASASRRGATNSCDDNRLSVATLDSMRTTGESIYEDAWETPDIEGADSVNEPAPPPTLAPEISSLDAAPHTPPAATSSTCSDRSAFEAQATILQERAALQLDAARISRVRHSLSTHPSEAAVKLLTRRNSAVPRLSTHSLDVTRLTTAASATSPTRPWRPKPLVLTPARTAHTPLTSTSSISPEGRRVSLAGLEQSSFSPSGSLATSPRLGSPTRAHLTPASRTSAAIRRRSMGYIASSAFTRDRPPSVVSPVAPPKRYSLASPASSPRLPLARDRSASEDTASSMTTITMASSSARLSGSTYASLVSSLCSGGKDGLRNSHGSLEGSEVVGLDRSCSSRGSTPLPAVSEVDGAERAIMFSPAGEEPLLRSPSTFSLSRLSTAAERSFIDLSGVSQSSVACSPFTSQTAAGRESPKPTKRASTRRTKYDEHWTGGLASDSEAEESDFDRPSLDVAAAVNASEPLKDVAPKIVLPVSSSIASATPSPKLRFDERRLSRRRSPPSAGAVVWPPPQETKTISLAPKLSYDSDSDSLTGQSGRDSEMDDEMASYNSPFRSFSERRRRRNFEARDPQARVEEADSGPKSFLEMVLNEEPPARPPTGAFDTRRRAPDTAAPGKMRNSLRPAKDLTKKLFNALVKSPKMSSAATGSRRPS